jgi:uncharacterized protein
MRILLFSLVAVTALTGPAWAQAFNCDFAKQPDELAVCRDDSLKALDEQMANSFFKLRQQLPPDGATRLKREQKVFLDNRKFCGTDGDCIADAYTRRIEGLCFLANDYGVECPQQPAAADGQN